MGVHLNGAEIQIEAEFPAGCFFHDRVLFAKKLHLMIKMDERIEDGAGAGERSANDYEFAA